MFCTEVMPNRTAWLKKSCVYRSAIFGVILAI
jgi:hypothetical protein